MIPIRTDIQIRCWPWVTRLLMLVNIGLFIAELRLPEAVLTELVNTWGLVPARCHALAEQASWTGLGRSLLAPFVSYSFLHGGWLHVIGNMWSLWLFGDSVEDRLGHGRYLLLYVLSGVWGGALHVALHWSSTVPTIGASAAISGVLGAYFVLFPLTWITVLVPIFIFPLFIKLPAMVYLLGWIVAQVAGGYSTLMPGKTGAGGVAFWAHVGGFAAGGYLGFRYRRRR